jgi:transcriptional regulator with XRE-family HTH domain
MARFRTPSAETFAGRIAQAIRAEMVRQNITQEELAAKLGWTQRRVSYRLTADHPIDAAEVEQVAAALGVPLSTLLPADDAPAEVTS